MSIPHRPYGSRYQHKNLPATIPIIGVGGSTFSCFYKNYLSPQKTALTTSLISRHIPYVKEWIQTIHYAIQSGIIYIDTAPWYGHGISEIVIGYALEELFYPPIHKSRVCKRKDLILVTKIGRYEPLTDNQFDYSPEATIISIKKSIKRLKCSYLDVVQIHDVEFVPNVNILLKQTIPVLMKCRDIYHYMNAIGITGYPLELQHEILVKSGQRGMKFDQTLTYSHCNLHDSSLFTNEFVCKYDGNNKRSAYNTKQTNKPNRSTTSFFNYCHDNQILSLTAAPLSMGLLSSCYPPEWHPAPHKLKQGCVIASQYCQESGLSLIKLALLYSLSLEPISCTILGMKDIQQVKFALSVASRLNFYSIFNPTSSFVFAQISKVWNTLASVCREQEFVILKKISDTNNGPFKDLQLNKDYQWNGKQIAKKNWHKTDEKRI